MKKTCVKCQGEFDHIQTTQPSGRMVFKDEFGKIWHCNVCYACVNNKRKQKEARVKAEANGRLTHLNSASWHKRYKEKK